MASGLCTLRGRFIYAYDVNPSLLISIAYGRSKGDEWIHYSATHTNFTAFDVTVRKPVIIAVGAMISNAVYKVESHWLMVRL